MHTSNVSWHEDATKTVRVLQIIVVALMMGASVFLGVALTVGAHDKFAGPILPIPLAWIAAFIVGTGVIARAVVLASITARGRREIACGAGKPDDPCGDARHLLSVFHTRTVVSAAIVEGWAFFATIAYIMEGDLLSLGLTIVLVLILAAHFPTQPRAIGWVERQMETLEQEKATQ